jgi:GntR family transcriptional regulator / MocR family aminotransferase
MAIEWSSSGLDLYLDWLNDQATEPTRDRSDDRAGGGRARAAAGDAAGDGTRAEARDGTPADAGDGTRADAGDGTRAAAGADARDVAGAEAGGRVLGGTGGRPRGQTLADALRTAIREGRLRAGTAMPSTRALAADLGVARGTVTRAYTELAAEGYLRTRQGAPTRVATLTPPRSCATHAEPTAHRSTRPVGGAPSGSPVTECPTAVPAAGQFDLTGQRSTRAAPGGAPAGESVPERSTQQQVLGARESRTWQWNLMPGRPDLAAFPRSDWLAATRRAVTSMTAADLGYGDELGHPRLRAALADYLGRVRGVVVAPDQVAVCSGYLQALGLLAAALRDDGARSVAFEDPSLPECRRAVEAAGLETVGVPVDGHGIRVDRLIELLARPDRPAAVVVTPAHQYPLGATLHPHRRAELVELARATDTLIVEDDYDGEFRFDRQPVGALQALAPDLVAYAGTASKTLAPGLRLSWLVLPDRLRPRFRGAKFFADRHKGVIEQLAFTELITAGHYDRHVRRCRTRYRRRRDTVVAVLTELGGRLSPAGIAAGLHVVVLVGDESREAEVLARTDRLSVRVEGLGRCWLSGGPHPGGIVVGYAAPADHAFTPALRALADCLGR